MSSTEEDNVLQRQSRGAGFMESELESESVGGSIIRGEKEVTGSGDQDENEEAGVSAAGSKIRGFGEKDVDDDEAECPEETGSAHSDSSDARHELDYLANKKCKLF